MGLLQDFLSILKIFFRLQYACNHKLDPSEYYTDFLVKKVSSGTGSDLAKKFRIRIQNTVYLSIQARVRMYGVL